MPRRRRRSSERSSWRRPAEGRLGAGRRLLVGLLRAYQLAVRPLLPGSCRFVPSCSEYACEAVRRHGVRRGVLLAGRRILRCHPWHAGGYDPVPAARG